MSPFTAGEFHIVKRNYETTDLHMPSLSQCMDDTLFNRSLSVHTSAAVNDLLITGNNVEQMHICKSKFSLNIAYEKWMTVRIKYRLVIRWSGTCTCTSQFMHSSHVLAANNQISLTTQIPWPFPDIGTFLLTFHWPKSNSLTFSGFRKFQKSVNTYNQHRQVTQLPTLNH